VTFDLDAYPQLLFIFQQEEAMCFEISMTPFAYMANSIQIRVKTPK
jgi:hypothetical protein